MVEMKLFEIRDAGTTIPAQATRLVVGADPVSFEDAETLERERWLLRRAGYGFEYPSVMLVNLESARASSDPYDWGNHTMAHAHLHIQDNWDDLPHGSVIDVEFILGEKLTPKVSEQLTSPY